MRKFIINILSFTGLSIVGYTLLLFIWGMWLPGSLKPNLNYKICSYGNMFTRVKEAKTTTNVDLLILGSSHAYRGFDTRIFEAAGLHTFNLGSSSQTPIQTNLLVDRYLPNLNPKQIIIEVYPDLFANDGVESSLDIIANDKINIGTVEMALTVNHVKTYNTLIFGFLVQLTQLNKNVQEPLQKNGDTYITGGYVEKELHYAKTMSHESQAWPFNPDQFAAFEELLVKLKADNIPVTLVYAPISKSLYQAYTNNNYFDSIMLSYGNYYNFNTMLNMNDTVHFFDADHLNTIGVNYFNQEVLKVITH